MRISDLKDDYMLNYENVIWIDGDIEHETLDEVISKIHYLKSGYLQGNVNEYAAANLPPRLYIRSNGGDSQTGIAIANLIHRHGGEFLEGWMVGDCGSTAATIWASCPHRYVMPHARLGIHPVMWHDGNPKYDAAKLKSLQSDFEQIDRTQCEIYAKASNKTFEWWWLHYNSAGDVKWFSAEQLVEMEMAELVLPSEGEKS